MRILGIESSCDECSFSVVEDGRKILGLVVYSQFQEHQSYGGVIPELASRVHIKYILKLYQMLCEEINVSPNDMKDYIDGIAVTVCPGLSGSLMVGLHFAKGLALALDKPIVGIDHILAHFYSGQLVEHIKYPYIGVVISGGHSIIALVHDYCTLEIKGASIDDACGEAFEKIAREFGLSYPGGPELDRLAQQGNADAANFPVYNVKEHGYNFSYSGLKTAVLNHRQKYWNDSYPQKAEHILAAFQKAAISMITTRVAHLIQESGVKRVCFGGGVACNSYLKKEMLTMKENNMITQLAIPPPQICADNAAMIAGLGYEYFKRNETDKIENISVSARKYLYKAYQP